ncbi:lysine-specific demethylase JMJ30 isoform X3 [Momordica charantia]|uniref:Lysine-specific demethylase JMJ30 isoform X3 n=1 Tax=Momordica charantia TaxID=3673 RepID=A0A6J1DMK3_MOMCH|nr:lysine-specific demethylase JMJ30 isoform X3 [Momordica charantia]
MSSSEPNGAPSSFHFETPLLDAQSPSLLHSISEHGGYAFVAMASLAAAGDSCAAEAAAEMAWEQLHSGPWHSVLPIWRDAYSMACLYMASFHFAAREFKEALRVLDMGLIMGGALLRKDLDSAIEKVSAEARIVRVLDVAQSDDQSERPLLYDERSKEVSWNLPGKALTNKMVTKMSALSLEGFLREHFQPGFPVIISDGMAHWPARTKWKSMDYLQKVAGDRTIPVEVGKNYLRPEWKQELITFSEFLGRIQSTDCSDDITYLAQHPLFDQINELRNDICIPDYCFVGGGELRSLNAWFGPAGTVTPLHHDPHHNILAQVLGKKYIRLYDASLSEELYPYTETMLCNSSQVDLDSIDGKEFPKAVDLEFVDCILEEGEMLYIPPKWWHYVRSLTTSFSVSFWWNNCENSTTS